MVSVLNCLRSNSTVVNRSSCVGIGSLPFVLYTSGSIIAYVSTDGCVSAEWLDINLDEGFLQVQRALTRMPTGQGYKETKPKTNGKITIVCFVMLTVRILTQ